MCAKETEAKTVRRPAKPDAEPEAEVKKPKRPAKSEPEADGEVEKAKRSDEPEANGDADAEVKKPKRPAKPAKEAELADDDEPLSGRLQSWLFHDAPSWVISTLVHMIILLIVALFMGGKAVVEAVGDAPIFETAKTEQLQETKIERFDLGEAPVDPTELTTESLTAEPAAQEARDAVYYDDSSSFEERGGGTVTGSDKGVGGMGFNIHASGMGPVLHGGGGGEAGKGTGTGFGRGGSGTGFGGRGKGHREAMVGRYGGTKQTERSVAAALNWIARHQRPDGSWSLNHVVPACRDGTCTGPGTAASDTAATAMGLLPFLAAGQTHVSKGPFQYNIAKGIGWLMAHQKPTGDLSVGAHQMYSHGLATIAMCEAYGMSHDSRVGASAQGAVNFIQRAQSPEGSWVYNAGDRPGDTSVFGWQMMGLKSALMAGLSVDPARIELSKKWLDFVSTKAGGKQTGMYGYRGPGGSNTMTSVGLLITQYLGAQPDDPAIAGGVKYLMANLPNIKARNIYYWYYATQVMHNMCGPDWDTWNRQMRRVLVESQCKNGCATGSWDPALPAPDTFGASGGRLMVTSLSTLTLEVYYRYLPLYLLDTEKGGAAAKPAAAEKGAKKE